MTGRPNHHPCHSEFEECLAEVPVGCRRLTASSDASGAFWTSTPGLLRRFNEWVPITSTNPKVQKNTVLIENRIPTSALFGYPHTFDIRDT